MKTPIQQIYDHLKVTKEGRGYGAEYCIDWLLENESKMLDKEKEVMCQFADEFAVECINFHHEKTMSQEQFFNLTFNVREK